jgi:hypothetical protein
MTIKELMDKLHAYPRDMKVVVDLHSEYAEVNHVDTIKGFENGGYVSRPHLAKDNVKVHGWLLISTVGTDG